MTPLIGIVVGGLVLAFLFGAVAHKLRLPPLIGYLAAGVAVGPFTPGFVADQGLANELAELGVILLMFGVGLHFSIKQLMAVRRIAVPGAFFQIAVAIALGTGLSYVMQWTLVAGLLFGLALSVASTVVMLRALESRRLVDTERGQIAVGWLIVEDLLMVFALVVIPVVANGSSSPEALTLALVMTALKVLAFVAFMLIVGRRVVPWVLHAVAHSGSRELFRLCVLAIALGVAALAALLFGVSFALGAFFAGMLLAESELSQRAAEETLPLRDAFAVLFFVSVGMLFNPNVIVESPLPLLATVLIILVGKSVAAYAIVRAFGKSSRIALTIAASLGQIGEFSFILAALGFSLGILPAEARDLILAGALISIVLNPLLFLAADRLAPRESGIAKSSPDQAKDAKGHVVLVGFGRVGSLIGEALAGAKHGLIVIESESDAGAIPAFPNASLIIGNAADPAVLAMADLDAASVLLVAIPDSFEAGQIVQQARVLNPRLNIIARSHSESETSYLEDCGASQTIMGEREIATRMIAIAKSAA